MNAVDTLTRKLQQNGCRLTKVRRFVLEVLTKQAKPLSAPDIQRLFLESGSTANKTTIYRELAFLKTVELIREVRFLDGVMRYELASEKHHHHLVCVDCSTIEDVVLEKDLDAEEREITRRNQFKILHHSLEFYGVCAKCQHT